MGEGHLEIIKSTIGDLKEKSSNLHVGARSKVDCPSVRLGVNSVDVLEL